MGRLNKTLQTQSRILNTNANKTSRLDVGNTPKTTPVLIQMDDKTLNTKEKTVLTELNKLTDADKYINDVNKVVEALRLDNERKSTLLHEQTDGSVYCAKTGRKLYDIACDVMINNYALVSGENINSQALSTFTTSIAPHFLDTSPDRLERLKLVDPCGLYVWLVGRLCGDRSKSFEKSQAVARGFQEKLKHVNERSVAFEIINDYYSESNTNKLRVAVANDFMLRTLALASHAGIYREFKKLKPLFISPTNCAKDINSWVQWVKDVFTQLCESVTVGKALDTSEQGITRKAEIMYGDTSFRQVVSASANARSRKREWINKLGIQVVVFNHVLDTITEEELLMPKRQNGAWPIDKLQDRDLRAQVHNNLIVKTGGHASKIRGNNNKAEKARKNLRKAVEINDFIAMADIKPMKGGV